MDKNPFLALSPIRSLKKVQFKSVQKTEDEVQKTEFNPSGLPSEPADVMDRPIVNNPDWLITTFINAAIELLDLSMTLDELRKRTETRASNCDAA